MKFTRLLSKIALSISLAMPLAATGAITSSTMLSVTQPAQAQSLKNGFKKFNRKLKKNIRKTRKKVSRSLKKGDKKKVLQLVGVGLAAYGISKGSTGAAILGVTLVAAPELFTKDIAKNYGHELNWSGCTRCNKKRIVSVPGREVSKKQKSEFAQRVENDVKDIQSALKILGVYKLRVDGDYGPGSRKAVQAFQKSLGVPETGYLNAEQRHLLFKQAQEQGYTRVASLDNFGSGPSPVPSTAATGVANAQGSTNQLQSQPAYTGPVISEFRLASSQFNRFAEEFLKSGNQTIVTDAQMLPDGNIQLGLFDQYTNKKDTVIGSLTNIEITAHNLSDSWIQLLFKGDQLPEPTVLNTRDDFASDDLAASWKDKAQQRLDILNKLVGVNPQKNTPRTLIASSEDVADEDNGRVVISGLKKDDTDVDGLQAAEKTTTDEQSGKIIIADNTVETKTPAEETREPQLDQTLNTGRIVIADVQEEINDQTAISELAQLQSNIPSEPDVSEEPAKASGENASTDQIERLEIAEPKQEAPSQNTFEVTNASLDPLAGFSNSQIEEICRQDLYVSFSFPNGEDPINHFNIVPPDGTIMMDNGDTTAYFTGSCVQGNYDFSYVHVKEAQKEQDWKHFKREGTFQIASNNEQCAIDLNTPDGSASIQCY